ncbi:MAG: hypothetical protein AB7I27_16660 [Bacteriovoracaceae bacterium]
MATIKSQRAKALLERPQAFLSSLENGMQKYPDSDLNIFVKVEFEAGNVKKLSFFGEVLPFEKVLIESMASLMIGKKIGHLENLNLRECEAFLRDKNSELAIEEMSDRDEKRLKKFFQWMQRFQDEKVARKYTFSSEKQPFRNLKLIEKIHEIKAFLESSQILTLYQNQSRPELVDVEELTVYIHAPYETSEDKILFEKLHLLAIEAFQEENLNFIPEA